MKCWPFRHKKRLLPWFYVNPLTQDEWKRLRPHWACTDCGKLWYKDKPIMIITTAEGRTEPWIKYEGEWIAKGYASQKEMMDAYRAARDRLIERRKW